MTPQLLLQHFDRIGEAPDAIPRLRRFILDLAVRGKLIEQDPRDEPASELLKRIQAEKARVAKRLETKKEDVIEQLEQEEVPFKLPEIWAWTRLGEICSKTGSGSTPRGGQSTYQDHGIPFFRSQNIYNDGLRLNDVAYIDKQTHQRMSGTIVKKADLLLNITGGSIGRCCRVPDHFKEANISQHVAIIRVATPGIQDFLHRLILSPYFQSFIFDEQTGAGRGGLPKNRMDRIPVALPPLAEQHRIVAKVDELMALCDRLETAQTERESRRDRLVASSLHHLNNGTNADAFQEHARFYFNHLPRLTTRPDHIKQLRQTILNLAVRGKLVPQDPTDEPASELLKRIQAEKTRLVETNNVRCKVDVFPIEETEFPFEIPVTWRWVHLIDVLNKLTDGTHHSPPNLADGPFKYITAKNIKLEGVSLENVTYVTAKVHNEIYARCNPEKGDILYIKDGATTGIVTINDLDEPFSMLSSVALLKLSTLIFNRLIENFLRSPFFYNQMRGFMKGAAITRVTLKRMAPALIPLPPLAEQHRIVAKVDELMGLCTQLETQLNTTQYESHRLIEAILHEALAKPKGNN